MVQFSVQCDIKFSGKNQSKSEKLFYHISHGMFWVLFCNLIFDKGTIFSSSLENEHHQL